MEENNNTVLIDVDLSEYIESLKDLQEQYAKTKQKIDELTKADGDNSAEIEQLTQQNKVLAQEMRGVEKQMQNEIKAHKAAEGSLVALRAELGNLQKKYDSMSAFERMGVEGQATQEKIARLTAEIQGLEESTGRWSRNVGNYKSALKGMKDATEAAGLSSKGLDRIMKGLSANPWVTVITVLVGILVKLRDRLKDNEKVTASLGNAMDSMKPIFDWFSKAISKIADIFSNVLDWAIQKVIQSIGWLGRQIQSIGKMFGKDWGGGLIEFSNTMKDVANNTNETTEATNGLVTSQEELQGAVKKTREAMETLLDVYKKVVNEAKKESLYDAFMKAGGTKTGRQVIEEMLQEDLPKLETTLKNMKETTEEMNNDSNEPGFIDKLAASFQNNAKDIESVSSSLQSSFSSLSSIYSQMAKDETKTEEERAAAAKKAKTWAAIQIAANSGTALAKSIATAMDNPWPANIAAIATSIATVMSAVAQAKALAADTGGYETGGVIGGYRGATMGHDNAVASVRTGEMVINAKQQRQLFEIANGGGSNSLAVSLAQALQSMPAPVLVYSEFQEFGSRVATLDEEQRLK